MYLRNIKYNYVNYSRTKYFYFQQKKLHTELWCHQKSSFILSALPWATIRVIKRLNFAHRNFKYFFNLISLKVSQYYKGTVDLDKIYVLTSLEFSWVSNITFTDPKRIFAISSLLDEIRVDFARTYGSTLKIMDCIFSIGNV